MPLSPFFKPLEILAVVCINYLVYIPITDVAPLQSKRGQAGSDDGDLYCHRLPSSNYGDPGRGMHELLRVHPHLFSNHFIRLALQCAAAVGVSSPITGRERELGVLAVQNLQAPTQQDWLEGEHGIG